MNPVLYQLNTRALLTRLGDTATLDDIPDELLDTLALRRFDWVWLLGVWSLGDDGPRVSRTNPEWRAEYLRAVPDLREEDISGSPFAVHSYTVDRHLGGNAALDRFRRRLRLREMKLLVDFVPNHVALDHPWGREHPDFFIHGTNQDLERDPLRWTRDANGRVLAYGRDPNYPGWPDTLQLNYFNPDLREAMLRELEQVAAISDGVRCDMAMLLEPEVFERTWGSTPGYGGLSLPLFWPKAIERIRRTHPEFLFMAEVYWNYEGRLQEHGFDYTYDKTLYDRLLSRDARGAHRHLLAPREYLAHMVHFLENHDEPRIASKLTPEEHLAAAVITFAAPGLRLLHDGQLEGKTVRIPVHLRRGPEEPSDPQIVEMYQRLLPILTHPVVVRGEWSLVVCTAAWEGNPTSDNFVAYLLEHAEGRFVIAVNYASYAGQSFVRIPDRLLDTPSVVFTDLLSEERYVRESPDLKARGLFLDTPAWKAHIFRVEPA
jgi:hypothetical protein